MHARHVPETIFYRWAIRELATVLACAPTTEAALAARGGMSADALARRLLGEANIAVLLVDHGYLTDETWTPEEMAARLPCRVLPVLRLETLAQVLIVRQPFWISRANTWQAENGKGMPDTRKSDRAKPKCHTCFADRRKAGCRL